MRGKSAIIPALLVWLCGLPPADAGLARYRGLVVADPPGSRPSLGIRVTYLGTSGYRFETGKHTLLLDPYFSRVGLGGFLFRWPIAPNIAEIENAADFFANAEAILATHGHVDHLFDVPAIIK